MDPSAPQHHEFLGHILTSGRHLLQLANDILDPSKVEAGTFRLEVEDTGIGIAAADLDRLFVEFQQLDAPLTKKHAGTGLGLALTKRIVEAQAGWVGGSSTLGQGSTFFAVLPRNHAAPPSPTGNEPAPR